MPTRNVRMCSVPLAIRDMQMAVRFHLTPAWMGISKEDKNMAKRMGI